MGMRFTGWLADCSRVVMASAARAIGAKAWRPVLGVAVLLAAAAPGAHASAINLDTWYQFGFTTQGTPATGCQPNDPAGQFCVASFGTPTIFVGTPAWTFVAPAGGVTLTVVDAFTTAEVFEIFDSLISLGVTSAPNTNGDCGDDPVLCLLDPGASQRIYALAAGAHSITISPTVSPDELGAAYFIVQGASDVPEPSTLVLTLGALAAAAVRRKQKAK